MPGRIPWSLLGKLTRPSIDRRASDLSRARHARKLSLELLEGRVVPPSEASSSPAQAWVRSRSRRDRLRTPSLEGMESRVLLTAPTVSTAAVSSITMTAAALNATVNPNGSATTARFQYSASPGFAPTVATPIGSGFSNPQGVAVDGAGDVFVADTNNGAVEEVLPNGTIKVIGSGFSDPFGVALDAVRATSSSPTTATTR